MFQLNQIAEVTDGITEGVDGRKQRGLAIAALAKIKRSEDAWVVPSQSGHEPYKVHVGRHPHCTCPDHELRGCRCKHIYAVEYVIQREENADGSTTVTESVTVSQTRKTYAQDWPAYNAAQQNEKDEFQTLLADLCRSIQNRPQAGRGRRYLRLADAVFAVTFKVYSTVSSRRFTCDLNEAKERGHIQDVPHFNSIFDYLQNPMLSDILVDLITKAALPLKSIESDFAVDSSGFMASRFHRWFDHKHGVPKQEHDWVKAHICTGVKTNVVTAVEIHERYTGDAPLLPALVENTAKNFTINELSADKAYASQDNFAAIDRVGATPFIPFKDRHSGAVGGLFEKAYHFFNFKRDEFLAHYHKRSNVESTFSMIKAKFGDAVRSKTDVAMKNEVLCKILCHNICCVIQAMHELGIEAVFGQAATCTTKGLPAR
jgi:transposase